MRSIVVFSVMLVLLPGCAQAPQPDLALACQTAKCTCLPESAGFVLKGEAAAVQWKSNGDAFCPDGYVLRRAEKKK
jgi:hypothetical protein